MKNIYKNIFFQDFDYVLEEPKSGLLKENKKKKA